MTDSSIRNLLHLQLPSSVVFFPFNSLFNSHTLTQVPNFASTYNISDWHICSLYSTRINIHCLKLRLQNDKECRDMSGWYYNTTMPLAIALPLYRTQKKCWNRIYYNTRPSPFRFVLFTVAWMSWFTNINEMKNPWKEYTFTEKWLKCVATILWINQFLYFS